MLNNRLNEAKIGTANVYVDILPKGRCIPNVKITPTSITIHQTGNIGASAKANHNYQKNCNRNGERVASWHFTVDDISIYQAQSTNYKCYHAGCASGNNTSIGIEICMFNDAERQKKAYLNAIELVKILIKYHGFNINQVKRHYDWTRKDCPQWLISGKFGYTWAWFKNQCKSETSQLQETIENKLINGDYNKTYEVKSSDGVLSVRASRPINGQLGEKLGELKNGDKIFIGYVLNNWGGVVFNDKQGFVNMEYLVEVVEEELIFKPYVVKVIVDELNVRADVGTSYAVVAVIKKGDAFTIVEEKNGWGKLKSGIGWINLNSKYVQNIIK